MDIKDNKIKKHFTASALIVNVEGKVLLVNHKKLGVWLYPGGHIEHYESPDEALVREVKEETGMDVKIISDKDDKLAHLESDVSVLHHPYAILCEKINGEDEHYHTDLIYLCEMDNESGEMCHDPEESLDIRFFDLEGLENLSLFPNFRKLLEKVLKKEN